VDNFAPGLFSRYQTRTNISFVIVLYISKLEKSAAIKSWFQNLISVQKFIMLMCGLVNDAQNCKSTKQNKGACDRFL